MSCTTPNILRVFGGGFHHLYFEAMPLPNEGTEVYVRYKDVEALILSDDLVKVAEWLLAVANKRKA